MVAVRIVNVDASEIFNLCSPRYLPDLANHWKGKRPWFDERYEPVRDLCEREYIARFDAVTGHYAKLKESVARDGFRNPVMLTSGALLRRKPCEVPPTLDVSRSLFCEYVGGSRVIVAQLLDLKIPAIVNDYANRFPDAPTLAYRDTDSALALFQDKPTALRWRHDGGLYANYLPYSHYDHAITTAEQIRIRRGILNAVLDSVQQWMATNDT